MQDFRLREFWDERCRKNGHTGWDDKLTYDYDQPLRMRAIRKALACTEVPLNKDIKLLDIGCGTGDLIYELVRSHDNIYATGIDISDEMIIRTRGRFANNKNVQLLTMEIENMDFPPGSFDLITSVTVLQHVTDEQSFSRAIENIVAAVKTEGYILILESSPIKVKNDGVPTSCPKKYINIRSRGEWISAFEKNGTRMVSEFGIPQIGITVRRAFNKIIKIFLLPRQSIDESGVVASNYQSKSPLTTLYNATLTTLFKLSKPFDYLLMPFPSKYTSLRILIFRKTNG